MQIPVEIVWFTISFDILFYLLVVDVLIARCANYIHIHISIKYTPTSPYKVSRAKQSWERALFISTLTYITKPLDGLYSSVRNTSSTLSPLIQLYTYRGFYFVTIIYPVGSLDCRLFHPTRHYPPVTCSLVPSQFFFYFPAFLLVPVFIKTYTYLFLYCRKRNWLSRDRATQLLRPR